MQASCNGRFLRSVRKARRAIRDITVVTLSGKAYFVGGMYPHEEIVLLLSHVTRFGCVERLTLTHIQTSGLSEIGEHPDGNFHVIFKHTNSFMKR